MGKYKLLHGEGKLPISITCDPNWIASSWEALYNRELGATIVDFGYDIAEPSPVVAAISIVELGAAVTTVTVADIVFADI